MKYNRPRLGALAVAALALAVAAPPAAAAAAPSAAPDAAASSGYTPDAADKAQNKRLQAIVDAALERKENEVRKGVARAALARTIYYDASRAPTFRTEISRSAQIWNSSVRNVRLEPATSGRATLTYFEGNFSRGSYAQVFGPGYGRVAMDYRQNRQYSSLRIASHETGHILGLPDRYQGPCSELMSGGGPGPSCTNPYPNRVESSRVDAIFSRGFSAGSLSEAAFAGGAR